MYFRENEDEKAIFQLILIKAQKWPNYVLPSLASTEGLQEAAERWRTRLRAYP
jgi:hypothetical protein